MQRPGFQASSAFPAVALGAAPCPQQKQHAGMKGAPSPGCGDRSPKTLRTQHVGWCLPGTSKRADPVWSKHGEASRMQRAEQGWFPATPSSPFPPGKPPGFQGPGCNPSPGHLSLSLSPALRGSQLNTGQGAPAARTRLQQLLEEPRVASSQEQGPPEHDPQRTSWPYTEQQAPGSSSTSQSGPRGSQAPSVRRHRQLGLGRLGEHVCGDERAQLLPSGRQGTAARQRAARHPKSTPFPPGPTGVAASAQALLCPGSGHPAMEDRKPLHLHHHLRHTPSLNVPSQTPGDPSAGYPQMAFGGALTEQS